MLSLKQGDPIAKVTTSKDKEYEISIYGKDNFNINKEEEPQNKVDNELALLDDVFYKTNSIKNKNKLLKDLGDGIENEQTDLAKEYIDASMRKKYKVNLKDNIFPIPQLFSERIYISAPSGAGKSYFTAEYILEIRKKFGKKREIFIFSRVDEDKSLDDKLPAKYVTRVPLEDKLWNEVVFQPEDFKNAICIFDDIDMISDKKLARKVQALRNNMLETGRHSKITVISTSHQIQNFLETRTLINEAQAVVLFPRSSSKYHVGAFLEKHMGLNLAQINEIYNLPTRWIYVHKQYPRYLIYQHGVYLL